MHKEHKIIGDYEKEDLKEKIENNPGQTSNTQEPPYQKPSIPIIKPTEEKVVYLTFDDGPSNRLEDLMAILDQYKAEATFFWLEPNMKEHVDEVNDAIDRGFSIGLHGVTHDAHTFYASSQSVLNEMQTAKNTLMNLSGYDTRLIRTPYGSYPKMTHAYKQAVEENGFIMWDWNVDSLDWKYRDSRYVNDVIAQIQYLEGRNITPIVLMHEISETIDNLPKLLNYLKENGFVFKKIDQNTIPLQF